MNVLIGTVKIQITYKIGIMMSIKSRLKSALHWHKFTTLLIYPPRPKYGQEEFGFLLRCDCGYTKSTNLPRSIAEVFNVKGE